MSTASRGASRERQIKKQLEAEGWICVRAAASKGAVDIWALKGCEPQFGRQPYIRSEVLALQVKGNAGSPWMHFRKAEREELHLIAAKAGAIAQLWHWAPNKPCKIYREDEWP